MSKIDLCKGDFSQSELRLLRVICDAHKIDDEPRTQRNESYQITKESMFMKLKKLVDGCIEDIIKEKELE